MKLQWMGVSLIAVAQLLPAQSNQAQPSANVVLGGYSSNSAVTQKDWEKKFRDGITPDNIRENMRQLSARPHHVGSAYEKENAEWLLSKFKEWGFDAKIETFNVLFPTPKERIVELVEPTKFRAKLQEPALAFGSDIEPDR